MNLTVDFMTYDTKSGTVKTVSVGYKMPDVVEMVDDTIYVQIKLLYTGMISAEASSAVDFTYMNGVGKDTSNLIYSKEGTPYPHENHNKFIAEIVRLNSARLEDRCLLEGAEAFRQLEKIDREIYDFKEFQERN